MEFVIPAVIILVVIGIAAVWLRGGRRNTRPRQQTSTEPHLPRDPDRPRPGSRSYRRRRGRP